MHLHMPERETRSRHSLMTTPIEHILSVANQRMYLLAQRKSQGLSRDALHIISERELTFAICCRPSVCLSVVCNARAPYTQAVVTFGNLSTVFGTLAIR